jgi:peptidoglycan/LPS O-acetylase OafA/YrhL
MGTYRLALALCVLLSHAGILFRGHNPGVSAVVSFFLLSGFVMTALIRRHYNSRDRIVMFYLDRAMRLFPQFFLYLTLTLILVVIKRPESFYLADLSNIKVFLNVLMLPLSLYMLGLEDALLIPQAWSLGLELTFYLIIPILLIYRLERIFFTCSIIVFVLAFSGVINTDLFGYRLLPGTMFMFLCGSYLHNLKSKWKVIVLAATYVAVGALFLTVRISPSVQLPHNYEVLGGFLIGLPIVALLTRVKCGPVDEILGNISYGVFLNHFLLIWTFQVADIDTRAPGNLLFLILCSGIPSFYTLLCLRNSSA